MSESEGYLTIRRELDFLDIWREWLVDRYCREVVAGCEAFLRDEAGNA